MEEKWINDFNLLTTYGCLGFYSFAKVTQIVLINIDTGEAWNYFTNIYFSSKVEPQEKAKFLTNKLKQINKKFKLAISTYTISIEKFRELYIAATKEQVWKYKDEVIDSITKLDYVFSTNKKYIPFNDPSGSQYQLVIPLEKSLYGSTFCGNYYVLELYSSKEQIYSFISHADIVKIQSIIEECHLVYDLVALSDRIGNVVCKFDAEVIKAEPLALAKRGIRYEFSLCEKNENAKEFTIHIRQEHDNLIYENKCYTEKFDFCKTKELEIAPNQCKNTITITDNETGLIVFMTINDYSVYSNYYSQISPTYFLSQGAICYRNFKIDDIEQKVQLHNICGVGDIYFWREMNEAGKRQQKWLDLFFEAKNYFKIYTKNSHNAAINDVRNILNKQILWDLEEVWLIDPYLMPKDILETVLFCEKPNIKIKCLTDFSSILNNSQTRDMLINGEEDSDRFLAAKENCKKILIDSIPDGIDVSLSYRTIAHGHGTSFHDRYLILKYKINKTRAWSLGISVNSLGNKHHIIQIVEAPELIADMFQKTWDKTDIDICKIYEINV